MLYYTNLEDRITELNGLYANIMANIVALCSTKSHKITPEDKMKRLQNETIKTFEAFVQELCPFVEVKTGVVDKTKFDIRMLYRKHCDRTYKQVIGEITKQYTFGVAAMSAIAGKS